MLPLGAIAPDFRLQDARGHHVALDELGPFRALIVAFICNHCPFVIHVADELCRLGVDMEGLGVSMVAINANDAETYPADNLSAMGQEVALRGYRFPYLFDATQEVAKAYRAACTPDFYLFNAQHELVYRGQLDESRPGNGKPVTGKDLRAAIDAILAGEAVPSTQRPSMGCNIKWKPGREPEYV